MQSNKKTASLYAVAIFRTTNIVGKKKEIAEVLV